MSDKNFVSYGDAETILTGFANELKEKVDLVGLGKLAYKDSASGSYTPQGTVSNPELMVTKLGSFIPIMQSVGRLPSLSYDSTTKALTFDAGTLPTKGTTEISFVDNVTFAEPPTFTGTAATITVE